MYAILDTFSPKRCFEWGSGLSTQIMATHRAVETLDSVEHDEKYFRKIGSLHLHNVNLHFEPRLSNYSSVIGSNAPYDFVFVDGRRRFKCLMNSKKILSEKGIVMIHDAERHWYHPAIRSFSNFEFTDEGSTALMSDDFEVGKSLTKLFNSEKGK